MITRAQAEALLTLAESLEACERLDVFISADAHQTIYAPQAWGHSLKDFRLNGMAIRLAVDALIPKQET